VPSPAPLAQEIADHSVIRADIEPAFACGVVQPGENLAELGLLQDRSIEESEGPRGFR
jgi:hypothetical protein